MLLSEPMLHDVSRFFRALGDPSRLRILRILLILRILWIL